jgi:hypothetical protein
VTVDGVTLSAVDGATATRIWNSQGSYTLRIYVDGSITLSVAEGSITGVTVNAANTNNFDLLTDVGDYSVSGAVGTWTGSAASVTFTHYGTKNAQVASIVVTTDGDEPGGTDPEDPIDPDILKIDSLQQVNTLEDGTAFHYDKSFIIYNNTSVRASYSNLCVGIGTPYNSQANNKWYDGNGHLSYEAEGYMPAIDGIWYFPQSLTIEPYQQVVVNCHGAIDNTQTYPESVNYAKADYYCMYDPEAGYVNVNYYPTPASIIPTDHYLKAAKIGLSNAWALSNSSPALFLFQVPDVTPLQFASNTSNMTYTPGSAQTDVNKVVKVPIDWIIDAIEVFAASYKSSNTKRLPASVDAGYVELTNQLGHTLYRNVDKAATEALPENEGKLVYNYAMSVQPDAEPSKIDAEASIKNGAHIVYMDTNNSTADFHERLTSSLKQ